MILLGCEAAWPKRQGKLSPAEVEKYLRLAREYFAMSGFVVGSPVHTSQDFQELGLYGYEEQRDAIRKALEEVRAEHYSGPDPPTHISGEPKLKANGWFSSHGPRRPLG